MTFLIGFVVFATVLRLGSLAVSIRNEKRLRREGAVEYGAGTSRVLASTHVGFYLAAIAESVWRAAPFSWVNATGLVVYTLSMVMLFWVILTLGRFWTVKIFIAGDHRLNSNWVFRTVRHPNYFLNIIPELVGFALALQAYMTLIVGLPIYAVILHRRIQEEEQAMRDRFPEY
ncbi:isoprenylcysteine carboxyl methyltransferase family protein [Roseibium aggregatum]|uniref:Isoprenylcysteine carboxyl methyltransferase family protein n=1 Tax=Roseibium aggregatum TaxID=187304 RepID=A0A939EG13_9HYPH|nr:isoprenylcysteine carboxyl methyltransferase family protein [Roseibium aggregatum]MBN9672556.1 isoprenylcysteine carboxyl methyltransferase family protein [Roseibium aggregatum]